MQFRFADFISSVWMTHADHCHTQRMLTIHRVTMGIAIGLFYGVFCCGVFTLGANNLEVIDVPRQSAGIRTAKAGTVAILLSECATTTYAPTI
jgi:hypothetical protein